MGGISFTMDQALFRTAGCYDCKAVALLDSKSDLIELNFNPDLIQLASILLPSYDASEECLNGNMNYFYLKYGAQLADRECDEFIALLMYGVYCDKKIMLYVGEDVKDIPYLELLLKHISAFYGYDVGTDLNFGMFNQSFLCIWLCKFYQYGFIGADEFLDKYPDGVQITLEVLNKLAIENPPPEWCRQLVLSSPNECNNFYMNEVRIRKGQTLSLYEKVQ